jgi:hypothetical protein
MSDEIEIPFEVPLDRDGYFRRQCPSCERILKWHHDTDAPDERDPVPAPAVYFCPYCGDSSPSDQWWTDEQVEHIQALGAAEALRLVEDALGPSTKKLNQSAGGLVRVDLELPTTTSPPPLFEPDDMVAVEPPCHPEEPIKVAEGWDAELHCIVCGERFVIPLLDLGRDSQNELPDQSENGDGL